MSTRPRLDGPPRAALDDINQRIRHLMRQPASSWRTQTYHELLAEWEALTRGDVEPAA
ncbi:hypothetical protein [Streptomyces sp. AGS-58]|uniref:hypothetical protein n=1 Tax=unclassified Streptomyces TaxID=2593676 RepID=UPI0035A315D0